MTMKRNTTSPWASSMPRTPMNAVEATRLPVRYVLIRSLPRNRDMAERNTAQYTASSMDRVADGISPPPQPGRFTAAEFTGRNSSMAPQSAADANWDAKSMPISDIARYVGGPLAIPLHFGFEPKLKRIHARTGDRIESTIPSGIGTSLLLMYNMMRASIRRRAPPTITINRRLPMISTDPYRRRGLLLSSTSLSDRTEMIISAGISSPAIFMTGKIRYPVVEDIDLESVGSAHELLEQMGRGGGFTAKKLHEAASIVRDMISNDSCFTFLSFPACIMSTGLRGVLVHMVRKKWVDAIITTCGTIDHDLARIWRDYHHGDFEMDDASLHRKKIHRLGNVLIPMDSYGVILEKKVKEILEDVWKTGMKEFSTREIVKEVGSRLDDEGSLTYWAAKNDIPVFIPGPTDGSFGAQLWMWRQTHRDFRLDLFKDEQDLSDIIFDAKETGALMIGGGISKHHVIWWNQFRDGLDYAVYITTAVEWDGSLSGARVKEGISWGKVKEKAPQVTVEGDATVLMPLMMAWVRQELDGGGP